MAYFANRETFNEDYYYHPSHSWSYSCHHYDYLTFLDTEDEDDEEDWADEIYND